MASRKKTPKDSGNTYRIDKDAIGNIRDVLQSVAERSPIDEAETKATTNARLRADLVQAHVKDREAERVLRKNFANSVLRYLRWYSVGVFALLLLQGFFGPHNWFILAEEVSSWLVGSTAGAVIGVVAIIAQGLFKPTNELTERLYESLSSRQSRDEPSKTQILHE